MKKYILLSLLCCGLLLFSFSCKKDSDAQSGYTYTEATHNSLNETVLLINGMHQVTAEGKDTTVFFPDTIKIKPNSVYSWNRFICTKNCPVVYYNNFTVAVPGVIKFIIGSKEKIDTACGFPITSNPYKTYDCSTDVKNYFNDKSWKISKDKDGHTIRKEYTIDESDVTEAK